MLRSKKGTFMLIAAIFIGFGCIFVCAALTCALRRRRALLQARANQLQNQQSVILVQGGQPPSSVYSSGFSTDHTMAPAIKQGRHQGRL